ncbi:Selenocysteine-specific elongation factor [invertebrate metagenome]|uniref:Selenocysteine-specific elongation factor n=1 Tax=invertebrate metagenome TaxID=1711999 RepID=A0A2H9T7Y5_9ZZZZ
MSSSKRSLESGLPENNDNSRKAVIGTAGHVDHGKTALIKALTGMNIARKEEQAKGMTLDLGFAHFSDDDGHVVGMIDVPGHERFIRNMVSGVWSLDLVLLVVAADEGWMPMSTDHLKVAHAMGVRDIILVINKSDTVDDDMLAVAEEEALEKCMEITGDIPDSVCVSAATGKNIDKLRSLITQHLAKIKPALLSHHAHLYIDRVFTVNGIGSVVTGSLVDGSVKIGDRLRLYPAGKMVQVRTLQSYHKDITQADPVSRVAMGIKGASRKELERGFCLVAPESSCVVATQLFVRVDEENDSDNHKNREVEVALGSWHDVARLVYIKGTRLARLNLPRPVSCFWGQKLTMIRHGGSELVHSGEIVWTGDIAIHLRHKLHELLDSLPDQLSIDDHIRLSLGLKGYAPVTNQMPVGNDDNYVVLGDWVLSVEFHQTIRQQILDLLEKEAIAITQTELATRLDINSSVLEQLLQALKTEELARMSHDAWMAGRGASEDDLGEDAQSLLDLVRQADRKGFEAMKVKIPGAQKSLRHLVRLGFITPLEGKIYYTTELYHALIQEILGHRHIGDTFGIPEVKEATGLSRKYMIPVLNRLELDGWVRREGDERLVMRIPEKDSLAA